MYLHANAKLGLAGRLALVGAVEEGLSLRAAAAVFNVSPATAQRWWHRWLDGGRRPQALRDHSSRPKRSPRLLAFELFAQSLLCERQHSARTTCRIEHGLDDTSLGQVSVSSISSRSAISRTTSLRGEVLSGSFVRLFREFPDQLLDDRTHLRV